MIENEGSSQSVQIVRERQTTAYLVPAWTVVAAISPPNCEIRIVVVVFCISDFELQAGGDSERGGPWKQLLDATTHNTHHTHHIHTHTLTYNVKLRSNS